jgi:hypothetical protein
MLFLALAVTGVCMRYLSKQIIFLNNVARQISRKSHNFVAADKTTDQVNCTSKLEKKKEIAAKCFKYCHQFYTKTLNQLKYQSIDCRFETRLDN